jgi:hypothetical protein
MKRLQVFKELEKGSSDEKSFAKIINYNDPDVYSDDETKLDESLAKIDKDIKEIEKVMNATDKNSKEGKILEKIKLIESFGDPKTVMQEWIKSLTIQKGILENKKKAKENTGGGNKTPEGKP